MTKKKAPLTTVTASKIIAALKHPIRVQILRHINEHGKASPSEMAEAFGESLGTVSYHVRVLVDLKLLKLSKKTPRRGAIEHHYEMPNGEKIMRAISALEDVLAA